MYACKCCRCCRAVGLSGFGCCRVVSDCRGCVGESSLTCGVRLAPRFDPDKQASKHYHTLLAGGLWPALTHPYKHGSRRDLWISSNSHKGKSSASHVVPAQRRVDRSVGADRGGAPRPHKEGADSGRAISKQTEKCTQHTTLDYDIHLIRKLPCHNDL